jgi:sec-independent protein translocase protein TatC
MTMTNSEQRDEPKPDDAGPKAPEESQAGKAPSPKPGEKSKKKSEEQELDDEGMTFWEHLHELRSRLIKIVIAAMIGAAAAWFFREEVLNWLVTPFQTAWELNHFKDKPQLHFPNPAGLFIAYLKLSIIAGLILSLPIIFYQLWAFVAPGLYAKEKRFAIPFVLSSTLLFCGGAYFGMSVAFPLAFRYLLSYAGEVGDFVINPTIMVDEYVAFITRMLLAFGTVFELPVLIFFLSVAGVVNHKHLIWFFRYFVVIAFVLGALITPPDLLSQFLLAVPLCGLYGVSIIIAWIFGKRPA